MVSEHRRLLVKVLLVAPLVEAALVGDGNEGGTLLDRRSVFPAVLTLSTFFKVGVGHPQSVSRGCCGVEGSNSLQMNFHKNSYMHMHLGILRQHQLVLKQHCDYVL